MSNILEDTKVISNTASESELNVITANSISINGIEYKASFESDGIKIPIVYTDINHTGWPGFETNVNKVFYLRIPKEEIMKMLKEYIPEVLSELLPHADNSDNSTNIIPL